MNLNRSSSNAQLDLKFRQLCGLPLLVSPRAIEKRTRRLAADGEVSFVAARQAERIAFLQVLRRQYRRVTAGRNAAAYAGTPAGRRTHRLIDSLTLEIAQERTAQCG